MPTRLFIGRARHYDDDGKPEAQHFYVALADNPETNAPCEVCIGTYELAELLDLVIHLDKVRKRPLFEPPSVVECPGRSGFEPRLYEALTLDEIEYVRKRLRL